MKSLNWKIGDVEIFQIIELEAGNLIQSIIRGASTENIKKIEWLHPFFADKKGQLKALVQSFLIKSNNKFILIDTCNGNNKNRVDVPEWSNLQTEFIKNLEKVGVTTSDIEIVACTHLHMDHVGWNTIFDGNKWIPTFPNAKYLFSKSEYEYWVQKPEKEINDDKAAFDDSVMPIIDAGLVKLVDNNYRIDQNISFIPTPGHTPSHVSVLIESLNQRAVISGDLIHHPCQIAYPEWATDADTMPDMAYITRFNLLKEISNSNTILFGSHFANPVSGKVVTINGKFKFSV